MEQSYLGLARQRSLQKIRRWLTQSPAQISGVQRAINSSRQSATGTLSRRSAEKTYGGCAGAPTRRTAEICAPSAGKSASNGSGATPECTSGGASSRKGRRGSRFTQLSSPKGGAYAPASAAWDGCQRHGGTYVRGCFDCMHTVQPERGGAAFSSMAAGNPSEGIRLEAQRVVREIHDRPITMSETTQEEFEQIAAYVSLRPNEHYTIYVWNVTSTLEPSETGTNALGTCPATMILCRSTKGVAHWMCVFLRSNELYDSLGREWDELRSLYGLDNLFKFLGHSNGTPPRMIKHLAGQITASGASFSCGWWCIAMLCSRVYPTKVKNTRLGQLPASAYHTNEAEEALAEFYLEPK